MNIWDDLLLPEDQEACKKYQSNNTIGFGKRPGVVIIDMTYGYVDGRFSTGSSKAGEPCVKNIQKLISMARSSKIPLIYTKRSNRPTPPQRGRGKGGPIRVVNNDLPDLPNPQEIVKELSPQPKEDIVIEKDRPSAFFGTNLAGYLNYYMLDTLIVTGMVTSGCVRATVVDAYSYNYRVIVPIECVADRSLSSHKISLFDMQMKYGDVIELDKVIDYIKSIKDGRI